MITIVLALLIGATGFFAGRVPFGLGSGIFLALVGMVGSYVLMARRIGKRVEAAAKEIEEHLGAQRTDKAIAVLQSMERYRNWQILLGSWIDAQIGAIHYTSGRADEARPHLERANPKMWQAKAMLAAYLFRTRRFDEMERVWEVVTKKNGKTSLVWGAYAWCQWKRGKRDQALQVLARARVKLPDDTRLQKSALAMQNMKRPKMRGYGAEWMALGLEDAPGAMAIQSAPGQRSLPPWARRAFGGRARRSP